MNFIQSVIFDIDGVLLDSLTPHLKICEDKNREYGLGLKIPNVDEFKKMVRRGVKISPMNYFFLAVGFPENDARRAFVEYKKEFIESYNPAPFPCIEKTLDSLHRGNLVLGIVTSNLRTNIDKALGDYMNFFDQNYIYSLDNMVGESKKDALISLTEKIGLTPGEIIYVGDQMSDWQAAKSAGMNFLGVTYGWGISSEEKEFPTIDNVQGISKYISRSGYNSLVASSR
jgi:N-acetyl-D-muramate 6-phosphate phosphatase